MEHLLCPGSCVKRFSCFLHLVPHNRLTKYYCVLSYRSARQPEAYPS